jgi:hypothetical protein
VLGRFRAGYLRFQGTLTHLLGGTKLQVEGVDLLNTRVSQQ